MGYRLGTTIALCIILLTLGVSCRGDEDIYSGTWSSDTGLTLRIEKSRDASWVIHQTPDYSYTAEEHDGKLRTPGGGMTLERDGHRLKVTVPEVAPIWLTRE